jgi:V/A-type H+-transporting ATPase subunit I
MIIKVKKILFWGMKNEIDVFFNRAQDEGFIEFIQPSKKIKEVPPFLKEYISALKVLKKQPIGEVLKKEETKIPIDSVVERINNVDLLLEDLFEKKRKLFLEQVRIAPFGDFSKKDLNLLSEQANRVFQFFCIKTSKAKDLPLCEKLIYVGTDYDLDYYISINKERKQYPNMIEIIIENSLGDIKNQIEEIEKEVKRKQYYLKTYVHYCKLIQKEFINKLNKYHLMAAKNDVFFPLDNSIFMIETWIPDNKEEEIKRIIKDLSIDYETIAIEEKERIPTYMENKGVGSIGEDLVNIYDTPDIKDKDPSTWVYFAFALFFAMIVSDAGYGLLYLCIAFFLKWKLRNPKPLLRRFTSLVFTLSISCIVWGLLTGSFFGVGVNPNNPISNVTFLNYISVKKASYHLNEKDEVYKDLLEKYPSLSSASNGKDFISVSTTSPDGKEVFVILDTFKNNILMELALLVGAIHICLSFLRNYRKHWAGLGWIVFIIGGYLYFPYILQATSLFIFLGVLTKAVAFSIGLYLIYIGIALAVFLAVLQQKISGIKEILNIIQVFADILSYLRLYALGLAGMIMATTFNSIGLSMPLFVGVFVILIGHLVNFALTIMSGVIHGLRLNFIEWYHYSFEGDGKLFNPLRLLK